MSNQSMGPAVITTGANFHVFQYPIPIYNTTCPIVQRTLLKRAA
jgi:hypothetical protein